MTGATERSLRDFIQGRTRAAVADDTDLFASGLVSSLFALELLVHVEQSFAVAVDGSDLTLDNFRTVEAMAALIRRLQAVP